MINKKVYLVIQNQTESDWDREVIDVVDTEEKARKLCKEYNKEYAHNVILDEDGLATEITNDDVYHFYEYKTMTVK